MFNYFVFFVLAIFIASTVNAQFYNFKNFSHEQGLPDSKITTLCEDIRGNLWIGTQDAGLLHYDGYTFHNYLKEDDGLVSNSITTIYEDNAGILWIGTTQGICTYDGIRFSVLKEFGKQPISAILQDHTNAFWIATATNGLFNYNRRTVIKFTTNSPLPGNTITCLYVDKNKNLWMGTPRGIGKYNSSGFKFYTVDDGLPSNSILGITEDVSGNLWIGTREGVSQLSAGRFQSYTTLNSLRNNETKALVFDDKGNLWLGTSGGISKFNGKSFMNYDAHIGQGQNNITCIYKDNGGNIWFGSADRGLSKLDSERFVHFPENDQMGKRVYAIIQAINGNLICGTSLGGTTVFDGKQYSLSDSREGFTSSVVQSFYYDADSTLWVGTQDEGLYKLSKLNHQHYTTEDGLASNNITGFAADNDGKLWIATADKGIMTMKSPNIDSLFTITVYNTSNGLKSNTINAIVCDKTNTIWIGTEDSGISRITQSADSVQQPVIEHFNTQNGLVSNTIHSIILDTLNNIYIGTSRGIQIYDGEEFTSISKSNGLRSNTIYSLTLDDSNNLWAGSERGIDKISFDRSFKSSVIHHFGNDDGFKGVEVYRNSSCKDREGNVWFGTVNGLVKYNPKEELLPNLTPKIHITGIRLLFGKIEDTPYADRITPWYAIPIKLVLPYHQNNLTFLYTGIHLRNPQAIRYRWMLEGARNEWSPPLTDREATFSNLPPGDYTFKVMACNEYNVWNVVPASFSFTIESPIWQRWWARVAGLIVLISIVVMIFQWRIKRIKAKNRIIQERLEMEKNILELEQEAARLQMNPHFIFNSLNSIQGFISTNDAVQAKKYLSKFAKLMRLILENAREEFIPLQNEVNILDNYLELEKLSANHKFDFVIHVHESIDPESIEIPPMMIQPFVENAIVHGIRNKEGKGNITLHFSIKAELIICEITDNGIGRKRSAQIKDTSRPHHKSTGISITMQRLKQYGHHRKVEAGISFIDLEENGIGVGTKVIMATPYEGSYKGDA
jgi:ligand-binding sensor domain-containing protein